MSLPDCPLPSLDHVTMLPGFDDPPALLDWSHREGARTVVLKMSWDGA
jgi:hypothetical protein